MSTWISSAVNEHVHTHAAMNDDERAMVEKELVIGEYRSVDLKHHWLIVIRRDDYDPHEWCHLSAEEA